MKLTNKIQNLDIVEITIKIEKVQKVKSKKNSKSLKLSFWCFKRINKSKMDQIKYFRLLK